MGEFNPMAAAEPTKVPASNRTTGADDNAHGVARDQLKSFVERIRNLTEEKKSIADDIKSVFGEAKAMGFDTAVLKKAIAILDRDAKEVEEELLILDTYLTALGRPGVFG